MRNPSSRLKRSERHRPPLWRCWTTWLLVLTGSPVFGATLDATERFSTNYHLIYQIRDIATAASSKSAIGSGFQVSASGHIVTNYHVVSNYVRNPDSRRLEFLAEDGSTGALALLDFDVINDLALLKRTEPGAPETFFSVADVALKEGEIIYAVGNPHDLGMTLVFGASNGMVEHSFNPQILFSGSLNPGMSGGPGLNAAGEVIGVNVATAGSQLSFLVPAAAVQVLLGRNRTLPTSAFDTEIAAQVKAWQRRRFDDLMNRPWETQQLGQWQVPGEIREDIQCWGRSNDDDPDARMRLLRTSCDAGNRVFLGTRLNTGQIHYSFDHQTALTLPSYRFHKLIGSQRLRADNAATDTEVTPYRCDADFLASDLSTTDGSFRKASYCVRTYKRLPGLYDVMFLGEQNSSDDAFSAHYTLAGVEQSQATAFLNRFLEVLGWTN